MDVIKHFTIALIIAPALVFGRDSIYPKDTIYIKSPTDNKKIENWEYSATKGIYFSIKDVSGKHISLFYPYEQKSDTLNIKHLEDYHFSNLQEINERRNTWIFDNDRPPANRNGVFQTYLIEVIAKDTFIKYPVIWRNEKI